MGVLDLGEFAAKLIAIEHDFKKVVPEIVAEAARILTKRSREIPGTYHAGWSPLQPETIARKANGDTPLLETGAMAGSYEYQAENLEAWVGSHDKIALFQEFGTSRGIPPRPVLGTAISDCEAKIISMARKAVAAVFNGHGALGGHLGELFELAHLVKETAEKVAERFRETVESDGREGRR